ncbi:MAG: methyltransferase domain-containing protein [Akkermansiaceae bacterium]
MTTESSVKERYAAASQAVESNLCCPVDYDPQYLKAIPAEVIERDYGCGDPSKYVLPGETVLDLGSGTGKICFIASQVVGPEGKVIGVDMTDDMLDIARKNAPIVAKNIGHSNVEFRKGRIQDLALDLEALDSELTNSPIGSVEDFLATESLINRLRAEKPLIESDSIDVVVSNCVLNLVEPDQKKKLFEEIFRVLKRGGRAVISDIVSDEPIPQHLADDADLWSGCISGSYTESDFLKAFEDVGFYGVELVKFETEPWQTHEGIEFRSVTVQAFKGKEGPCMDHNQAVIYKGPFKSVLDDDGHRIDRGVRVAVCSKTYDIYKKAPYAEFFEHLEPLEEVSPKDAKPFDCERSTIRQPSETKGQEYRETIVDCGPDCC